ncbi:MAG: DUF937 domain-containing protein [Proteobacteria bacterium]|jgi:uncharacterized protein YidB (DUF937 family)|nr:DUF937 domain-containing protein [Pseudomonadota bacterium]MBK7114595.1 DUF937 domain-containing protein [Pseudomonadota bacterium]MBK9253324.1 DUF937 domain-containing protein [Pseudomonadota bacterium]MCC6632234.1 DUF937 domain-containing protein [Gammaproteobacteria bacterium]
MGLLDGVLGGVVGAVATNAISNLLQHHGGVGGIVQHMEKNGLGDTVKSWVGKGSNLPISPAQLQQAFGPDKIGPLAKSLGVSPDDLLKKIAAVLPDTIDKMTPDGVVPKAG